MNSRTPSIDHHPGAKHQLCAPRSFTHGHGLQLASVARAHLVTLVGRTGLLPGIETRALVDIDSLLRPVFGHAKQGASFGHTKIAGRRVLRKGLSPLATTISTEHGAPVVAGIRLRAGKAGSGRGAASMVREAIRTARAAGAVGQILVRGDSAYGTSAVVDACVKAGARFSVVLTKNPAVSRAIAAIADHAWTPVHYPGAVVDPDTGQLISDAEVAEVRFTAFATTKLPVTARLVVRRVRDRARGDELFPVWRYHPFFTNSAEPTAQADITHRRHAIIETVFADLIDGPLAHLPSGRFAANNAWAICAAITHNLLRAAGTLTSAKHAVARGATLRRHLVTVPARLARPQTPPSAAPTRALALGHTMDDPLGRSARHRATGRGLTRPPAPLGRPDTEVETLGRPASQPHLVLTVRRSLQSRSRTSRVHGSRLSLSPSRATP